MIHAYIHTYTGSSLSLLAREIPSKTAMYDNMDSTTEYYSNLFKRKDDNCGTFKVTFHKIKIALLLFVSNIC